MHMILLAIIGVVHFFPCGDWCDVPRLSADMATTWKWSREMSEVARQAGYASTFTWGCTKEML